MASDDSTLPAPTTTRVSLRRELPTLTFSRKSIRDLLLNTPTYSETLAASASNRFTSKPDEIFAELFDEYFAIRIRQRDLAESVFCSCTATNKETTTEILLPSSQYLQKFCALGAIDADDETDWGQAGSPYKEAMADESIGIVRGSGVQRIHVVQLDMLAFPHIFLTHVSRNHWILFHVIPRTKSIVIYRPTSFNEESQEHFIEAKGVSSISFVLQSLLAQSNPAFSPGPRVLVE